MKTKAKEHSHIKPNCKLCFTMWRNGKEDGEEYERARILEMIDKEFGIEVCAEYPECMEHYLSLKQKIAEMRVKK